MINQHRLRMQTSCLRHPGLFTNILFFYIEPWKLLLWHVFCLLSLPQWVWGRFRILWHHPKTSRGAHHLFLEHQKCVNSWQNCQNRPRFCVLYAKKYISLKKNTLPPIAAVVTNMTYAGCRTFKLHCWWIVRAMAVPWMSLTGTLPQVVKNFK